MVNACGICGDLVRTIVPGNWHPSKRLRIAQRDMQAHLKTHSFAEVLRFEIRQDLDQVPEEQRPTIVRDVYRSLLGHRDSNGSFAWGADDGVGVYTIDEALGSTAVYRLWRTANTCALKSCEQHAP
jgi:hypothetical protein